MQSIVLALLIGGAFGFVLDRVGATNPNLIIGMLRLGDMHLMKVILLAIGFSSILLFAGLMAGWIEPGQLSVKSTYIAVFFGGLLLGIGFAIAGYCPGTGLVAAATGRKDALWFVLGGLVGAAAYMGTYTWFTSMGILDSLLGGKVTVGIIEGTDYSALFSSVPGELIGIGLGVVLILIAIVLPTRILRKRAHDSGSRNELMRH